MKESSALTAKESGLREPLAAPPAASRSKMEEEFALLMTACAHVVHAPPPPALAPGASPVQVGVAENWRRVDGPVTAAPGDARPAAPATSARFVTHVLHPELGAMDVTVERKEDSVRVVFEVADAVAQVALETQRSALVASLHAAGVQVASVAVSIRAGGTALAPRVSPTRAKRANGDASPAAGDASAKSGLDLVG